RSRGLARNHAKLPVLCKPELGRRRLDSWRKLGNPFPEGHPDAPRMPPLPLAPFGSSVPKSVRLRPHSLRVKCAPHSKVRERCPQAGEHNHKRLGAPPIPSDSAKKRDPQCDNGRQEHSAQPRTECPGKDFANQVSTSDRLSAAKHCNHN